MTDWLMSLDGKPGLWADATVDGRKRLELRRGPMAAERGDRVWIYATVPQAAVIGWARFESCEPFDVERLVTDKMIEQHLVGPVGVERYAKGMRSLWGIRWSAAGRMRRGLDLPLRALHGFGFKPTPTWVRLVDRPPPGPVAAGGRWCES